MLHVLLALVGSTAEGDRPAVGVTGPLGAQFLGWEYATAVAGRILSIDPFDQPNVTESKENTQAILSSGLPDDPAVATDGAIEIRASGGVLDGVELGSTGAVRGPGSLAATTLRTALSSTLTFTATARACTKLLAHPNSRAGTDPPRPACMAARSVAPVSMLRPRSWALVENPPPDAWTTTGLLR